MKAVEHRHGNRFRSRSKSIGAMVHQCMESWNQVNANTDRSGVA